jgi:beta-lactam-binding protein with PASTA domain
MPIVVGIVVLILLAALGWGLYVIVQNSGGATPAPTASPSPSVAPARIVATTPSEAVSTEPTTAPTTTATTAEPTAEVTIPALRGLALPDAQAALTRTGLKWRVLEIADEAPAGTVIDSDPAEGQEVPPATRVTLVVAAAATTTPATTATTTEESDVDGN